MSAPLLRYRQNRIWDVLHIEKRSLGWLSRTLPYNLGGLSRMANGRQTVNVVLAVRIAAALGWAEADMFSEPVYGRPPRRPFQPARSLPERFWMHANPCGDDECWTWSGSYSGRPSNTVPCIGTGRTSTSARRVGWQTRYANLLMRCGDRHCVNPRHMYISDAPHVRYNRACRAAKRQDAQP